VTKTREVLGCRGLKMYQRGRLCIKIAGRDAGRKCIIIDVIDKHHVMIDGETRRRKCNVKHLEPLDTMLKVTKNAPRTEVVRLFKTLNIDLKQTKPKKKTERPKKLRKKKAKPVKQPVKKTTKKEEEKIKKQIRETQAKPLSEKPKKEGVLIKKKERQKKRQT